MRKKFFILGILGLAFAFVLTFSCNEGLDSSINQDVTMTDFLSKYNNYTSNFKENESNSLILTYRHSPRGKKWNWKQSAGADALGVLGMLETALGAVVGGCG